jgi:hypothetical protein
MNRLFLGIKDIFTKFRGNRGPGSNWSKDVHNPRNNFVGFNNPEFPEGKRKFPGILRFLRHIVIALILALGAITALDYYYGPDFFKLVTTSKYYRMANSYLTEKMAPEKIDKPAKPHTVERSTGDGKNRRQYEFTAADIEKAKEKILIDKNRQYWTPEEIDRIVGPRQDGDSNPEDGGPSPYFYDIELVSGARLSSENISLTDGVVEIIDSRGLVVTIKKNEVKSIKRLKAAR